MTIPILPLDNLEPVPYEGPLVLRPIAGPPMFWGKRFGYPYWFTNARNGNPVFVLRGQMADFVEWASYFCLDTLSLDDFSLYPDVTLFEGEDPVTLLELLITKKIREGFKGGTWDRRK